MPISLVTVDVPLAPLLALQLNRACDQFEAAWKATAPGDPGPRVEDYLAGTPDAGQAILLRDLVLLDVDYRRLRGESLTASEYDARFPGVSDRFLAGALAAPPRDRPAAKPPAQKPAEEADGDCKGVATVLTPPFQPQIRSNRYVIRKYHAHGGIGEIWLAEDAEIGRQVALKRLRKRREDQQDRFLVEAQITGQLEHPGIVPVHDLGVDEGGRAFYVMSFIHGQTLKAAIEEHHAGGPASAEQGAVQFSRLLEVFVKVCQAVAYAHHRGVVHRDLKPDNVMLGPFGEAVVLDWGMAKVRGAPEPNAAVPPVRPTYGSGSSETQAGAVMGSPPYMAPEVADGRAADADERTDVYLLGATLYHVLTGQAPRQGRSQQEIVELARTVPPPPPRRLRPDLPRALEAICLKAMAHRTQDRYANALELCRDMERYLAGAPVTAYREPALVRAVRWGKRHRRALGRSLAAAVVLSLAVVSAALVREARNWADLQGREAEELRRCGGARDDLREFHRLTDECQFHANVTTPSGESAVYYDARRGQAAGQKAIALAGRLAGDLEQLPLPAERAALDRGLHTLLLLTAQGRCQHAPDRGAAPEILESLERAASLGGPTRGYHRLRARCYRALGDDERAAEEGRRADAAPATALDHFLEGEECRSRAETPGDVAGDGPGWRPNQDLQREAIAHYQRALRVEPDHFWSHLQMGRCYMSLGQGPEALEALGTCVALRKNEAWGYSARGLALGLMQRYDDGEADLERALALDPEFRPARLHRGVLAWLQGKDERALDDFAQVLEPPDDRRLIEAAYYRGQLRLRRKEYPEALKDFDLVVKENPSFRPAYLSRAQVHYLRGDDARGLADLTTFLDLARAKPFDPKDPQLLARRGHLLAELVPRWGLEPADYVSRMRLARDELEAARRQGHRSADLLDDLGSVAQKLQAWDEACAAYEQALRAAPPSLAVKVRTKRGWIYAQFLRSPQYDRARDDFSEAIRLDPAHADAHAGLGYVQALRQLPAEAQREAAQALWQGGDDYLLLHNVACIYAVLSQVDKGQAKQHQDLAMHLLRRAVESCRRTAEGEAEVQYIRSDPALRVLSSHPDYKKLVAARRP
jgi:tetratricopeptide (TPR) repeat protein/tRNA A-37 threonylcarbamoyl transferase component Bud32